MRMCVAGLAMAALGLAGVASAQAAAFTSAVPISLAEGSFAGLPAGGQARFAYVDSGLAEVGDVNGDGLADVAIGAASADAKGRRDAGVVYVVFGGASLGRIDLASPALPGFRIVGPRQGRRRPAPVFEPDGPPAGAMAGSAVAGAATSTATGWTTSWSARRMRGTAAGRTRVRRSWCSASAPASRSIYGDWVPRATASMVRIGMPRRGMRSRGRATSAATGALTCS